MKKLLHLVFLLSFYFGFSQSEEEYSSFHFELGSHQKILVSNTKVRKCPELGTVVIDSLSPGNDIKIIYRTPQNFKIGERHAPWFKVSYEKNGTPTEGYIWGGNIALGHRKYNDVQLLFGIASTQKIKNKGSEGDYNEMIARVVALKDNQVISERNFEMGNSENLSGYGFKIIENQKLKNVDFIVAAMVSGEACGVPTYEQYFLWSHNSLVKLPRLMSVGDADVYSYSEEFQFFKNGKIMMKIEQYEKDENNKETTKKTSKTYFWDGKELK